MVSVTTTTDVPTLLVRNREYREIPTELLRPHPHNPNRGDGDAISESMNANGFYGACTVRDNPLEPGTYQILAGEHRWRESAGKGLTNTPCIVVEADDVVAARILLADNETARRGSYDPAELTFLLRELGSVEGTGFVLDSLAAFEDQRVDEERAAAVAAADADESEFVREYGVIVYCDDETAQQQVYEKLRAEGYRLRIASI